MPTRRGFAAFASCAITGFAATDASSQGAPAPTPGVKRKVLSQADGPAAGYMTLIVEVEVEPDMVIGRHTHPGIESGYVVDGEIELPIDGEDRQHLRGGEGQAARDASLNARRK